MASWSDDYVLHQRPTHSNADLLLFEFLRSRHRLEKATTGARMQLARLYPLHQKGVMLLIETPEWVARMNHIKNTQAVKLKA
jgi:hypothetical protein